MVRILVSALLLSIVWASCKKSALEEYTLSPTLPPKPYFVPPADTGLGDPTKTMIWGLLGLSTDEDFKELVTTQVLDTFDGDYNVLLYKLYSTWYNVYERDLAAEMAQSIDDVIQYDPTTIDHPYEQYNVFTNAEDVYDILHGFEYDEQQAYLQIYIPYIDQVNLEQTPTICFGHQEVDTTLGYQWNGEEIITVEVDSNYAKSHLVWVISVNEVVDESGSLMPYVPDDGRGQTNNTYRSTYHTLVLTKFKVSDKKEAWVAGKAEVHFIAARYNYSCQETESPIARLLKPLIGNNKLGVLMYSSTDYSHRVLATYYGNEPPPLQHNTDIFAILLYEYDKYGLTHSWTPCSGLTYPWKSNDSMYGWADKTAASFPNSTSSVEIGAGWNSDAHQIKFLTEAQN